MTDIKGLSAPGTITIRGKQYQRFPIDCYGMALMESTPNEKVPMLRATCDVVAKCLGISFDEVFGTKDTSGFSEEELVYVLNESKREVRSVEASAPPNSEPAGERAESNLSLAG